MLEKGLSSILFDGSPLMFRFFHSRFTLELLKLTPYFMFHYIYGHLLEIDSDFRTAANKAKQISAAGCFRLRQALKPGKSRPVGVLTEEEFLVSKLTYRYFKDETADHWMPILRKPTSFSHPTQSTDLN
jgi:hypothetical protein